jgi:hypothetical protein
VGFGLFQPFPPLVVADEVDVPAAAVLEHFGGDP